MRWPTHAAGPPIARTNGFGSRLRPSRASRKPPCCARRTASRIFAWLAFPRRGVRTMNPRSDWPSWSCEPHAAGRSNKPPGLSRSRPQPSPRGPSVLMKKVSLTSLWSHFRLQVAEVRSERRMFIAPGFRQTVGAGFYPAPRLRIYIVPRQYLAPAGRW